MLEKKLVNKNIFKIKFQTCCQLVPVFKKSETPNAKPQKFLTNQFFLVSFPRGKMPSRLTSHKKRSYAKTKGY